jgi:hypothetical protein
LVDEVDGILGAGGEANAAAKTKVANQFDTITLELTGIKETAGDTIAAADT